jgi:hypothetical protein
MVEVTHATAFHHTLLEYTSESDITISNRTDNAIYFMDVHAALQDPPLMLLRGFDFEVPAHQTVHKGVYHEISH